MQVGGATSLAEMGIAPNLIQVAGRWTIRNLQPLCAEEFFPV